MSKASIGVWQLDYEDYRNKNDSHSRSKLDYLLIYNFSHKVDTS
jgi:hypothetical protein